MKNDESERQDKVGKVKRVETLDYLRGLMALMVLVYHFVSWEGIVLPYPFDNFVSRLGLYAVSAFYVLSGISLALVYLNKDINKDFILSFFIRRVYRIAPLFYLATILTIGLSIILGIRNDNLSNVASISDTLLNLSFLFSWFDHDNYIATGAWSIGNELFFYTLFPLMLLLIKRSIKEFVLFFLFSISLTLFFSYAVMDTNLKLVNQWSIYINPINQLYFFVGGVFIGWIYRFKNVRINKNVTTLTFWSGLLMIMFLPSEGNDQIFDLTGFSKILLSLAVFAMSFSAMFAIQKKAGILEKPLKFFGEISYSIYLLHPIVYKITSLGLGFLGFKNTPNIIILSVVLSITCASLSYYLIEKRFVRIGKEITAKETYVLRKMAS